jgi:hypothetical protein
MPDFAPNVTGRVVHTYKVLGKVHRVMIRYDSTGDVTTAEAAGDALSAAIEEMTSLRYSDWADLGWEFCAAGDDVFYPIATITSYSAGAVSPSAALGTMHVALQTTFVGRSTLGNLWKQSFYGLAWNETLTQLGDFRISDAESAPMADARAALASASSDWVAIDNAHVVIKPYATINYNDKWIKILRKGA